MTQEEVIKKLQSLSNFYLGGSRFFNRKFGDDCVPISDQTDYDLYAQYSPENEKILQDMGFVYTNGMYEEDANKWQVDLKYPVDNLCHSIYKHENYPIEVLLRLDVDKYRDVIERIDVDFYRKYLWKSSTEFFSGTDQSSNHIMHIMNQLFKMVD